MFNSALNHSSKIALASRRKLLLLAGTLLAPLLLAAEDIHWTGAVDEDFGNEANWEGGAVPGPEECAVFEFGATVMIPAESGIQIGGLLFDTDEPVVIEGIDQNNLFGINFREGVTVLRGSHTIRGGKTGGVSGGLRLIGARDRYFDISKGAALTLDVRVRHNTSGLDGDLGSADGSISRTLVKRGGGELVLTADNGGSSSWNFSSGLFLVEEGTLVLAHDRSSGQGSNNFAVADGATLEIRNGLRLSGGDILLSGSGVNSGGALRSTGSGGVIQSHDTGVITLVGDATIGVEDGPLSINRRITEVEGSRALRKTGNGRLEMNPQPGHDYTGGTVVEAGRLIVGNSNALGLGPVFAEGGVLHLEETPELGVAQGGDFYSFVWYPSEGDATRSSIRIHEGFNGPELARADWGGLFPSYASGGMDGIGDTYQLEATGTYGSEGELTLSFSLTDATGHTDTVAVVIDDPFEGNAFGIGGMLESSYSRVFDFDHFSISAGADEETLAALDFGSSQGKDGLDSLTIQRAEDFSLQPDSLRYQATAPVLSAAHALTPVAGYVPGDDFALAAEMTLVALGWPGEDRIGFAALGNVDSPEPNKIHLAGGQVELAEGISYASIRSISDVGLGTVADFLSGESMADETTLYAAWSEGGAGDLSDVLEFSTTPGGVPVAPAEPLSAWLLDGDLQDAFGGHDGSELGDGIVFVEDGPFADGSSVDFRGSDGAINIGNPPGLQLTAAITAATWIRIDDGGGYIFNKWDTDSQVLRSWAVRVSNGRASVMLSRNGYFSNGNRKEYAIPEPVDDGEWHHLAFTFFNGDLTVYFDGAEVESPEKLYDDDFNSIHNNSAPVMIGSRSDHPNSPFNGWIGESAIWSYALTANEIAWLGENSLRSLEPVSMNASAADGEPIVLAMELDLLPAGIAPEDLNIYHRAPGGGSRTVLGSEFAGMAPWSPEQISIGQYGLDPETGQVWVVTDRADGFFVVRSEPDASGGQSYDEWADAEGIPEGERDPALDRYGRGVPNLISFVTGIAAAGPGESLLRGNPQAGAVEVQFPVRTDIEGASFQLMVSSDLRDWQPVENPGWEISSPGGGRELWEASFPLDSAAESRLFYRIEFQLD